MSPFMYYVVLYSTSKLSQLPMTTIWTSLDYTDSQLIKQTTTVYDTTLSAYRAIRWLSLMP